MNIDVSKFGEGFFVTIAFFLMFTVLALVAIVRESNPAVQIVTSLSAGVTAIVAFWFATRGQTGDKI